MLWVLLLIDGHSDEVLLMVPHFCLLELKKKNIKRRRKVSTKIVF